ncbi:MULTISPECIES: glycosyltransferase family 2 protein [Hydrotalea]|uniref:glycosyltransferase family 2 protein n=1 Tax=Hydrotalea TaxID=1004300 RepID=UPI000943E032|nr:MULTISPECIES: glycosyltransferase family 2 protein [Hydrotalea]RWZ88921.1 MAG: glycosyltransferase family 2 protein [Hydrotalea sp. AMD]
MQQKVLLILPCYNEETALPGLLSELAATCFPENYQVDVLVVNDCSKDGTAQVARRFQVTLVDLPMNLGIGGAVQTGIKYAYRNGYDMAIQLDGDGQHPPNQVQVLLAAQKEQQADVVIGSRFVGNGGGFQSSLIRRMGIRYFHWLNRLFTGNRIFDSTSGFRLLNQKAIALAAAYYPDEYPEPESLILFSKAGCTIVEVPVLMRERQGGASSIGKTASVYYSLKVTLSMFFTFIRHSNS